MLTAPSATPVRVVDTRRDAEPDRGDVVAPQLADDLDELVEQRLLRRRRASGARPSRAPSRRASTTPARIFVPPRSTPMTRVPAMRGGYPTPPDGARKRSPTASIAAVASRARCRPAPRRARRARPHGDAATAAGAGADYRGPRRRRRRQRAARWRRRDRARHPRPARARRRLGGRGLALGLAAASRTRTSGSTPDAKRALATQNGLLLSHPTTILLLGTDNSRRRGARGRQALRLDHAAPHRPVAPPALLPLDPARPAGADARRTATRRSTPRSRSAARRSPSGRSTSSRASTINHVDRRRLRRLQGPDRRRWAASTSNVPEADPLEPVRLPVRDAGALPDSGTGWRFAKGTQHMNGERALIYSRIRENQLDPRETRLHARRAPAGGDAGGRRRSSTSFGTCSLRLPFTGGSLLKPLDDRPLDRAAAPARLGEVPRVGRRTRSTAGSAATVGGGGIGSPSEDNRNALAMWLGRVGAAAADDARSAQAASNGHPLQ